MELKTIPCFLFLAKLLKWVVTDGLLVIVSYVKVEILTPVVIIVV
jgi:hypothetical protein